MFKYLGPTYVIYLHRVPLTTSKKMQKKLLLVGGWVFIVTELFNTAINEYGAMKSARYSRVLIVLELVISGPKCTLLTFSIGSNSGQTRKSSPWTQGAYRPRCTPSAVLYRGGGGGVPHHSPWGGGTPIMGYSPPPILT